MEDGIARAFALLGETQNTLGTASDPASPDAASPSPEVQRLQTELDAARADVTAAQDQARRTALKGNVTDLEAAMKLIDPEKHLDDEGNVNISELLWDFPSLKLPMAPTAPDGGGGTQSGMFMPTMETAVRSGEPALINMVFEDTLSRGRDG